MREMCHAVTSGLEGRAGEVRWHGAVLCLQTAEDEIALKIVGPLPTLNSTGWCPTQTERWAEIEVWVNEQLSCVHTSNALWSLWGHHRLDRTMAPFVQGPYNGVVMPVCLVMAHTAAPWAVSSRSC